MHFNPASIYTRYGHSHPAQVQHVQHFHHPAFVQQKPKSLDNLAAKANPIYAYGYILANSQQQPTCTGTTAECHRNQAYPGRFFVENYAPPPVQFLHETTTIVTTITTKSTENIYKTSADKCECGQMYGIGGIDNVGYYSKISRSNSSSGGTNNYNNNIPVESEVTRL